MKIFDILLAKVDFEDNGRYKIRPVLCIRKNKDNVIARKITSKEPGPNYPGEYPLKDWKQEGLNKASVIRMSKHTTIPCTDIKRVIGHLTERDAKEVMSLINTPYKESYNIDDEIDEYVTQLI